VSDYGRYMTIAYMIIGTVALGFGVGYFLDWILNLKFPVFKLIGSFGGVCLAMYLFIKEWSKKDQ